MCVMKGTTWNGLQIFVREIINYKTWKFVMQIELCAPKSIGIFDRNSKLCSPLFPEIKYTPKCHIRFGNETKSFGTTFVVLR